MIAWISLIIITLKKPVIRPDTKSPFTFDFPSVSVKLHTIAVQWFMSLSFHKLVCAICPCDLRNNSPSVCVRHMLRLENLVELIIDYLPCE